MGDLEHYYLGPVVLLLLVGLVLVVRTARRHDLESARHALYLAVGCTLAGIATLTLVPSAGTNEQQFIPLLHLVDTLRRASVKDVLLNVVGNVVLFMPVGAALRLLGASIQRTLVFVGAVSAVIEVLQLVVPGRTTSADDVLLNVLGAAIGYALGDRLRHR
jgi:glycopeptide antibiotics resistance protein